jgi:hypothetical protein
MSGKALFTAVTKSDGVLVAATDGALTEGTLPEANPAAARPSTGALELPVVTEAVEGAVAEAGLPVSGFTLGLRLKRARSSSFVAIILERGSYILFRAIQETGCRMGVYSAGSAIDAISAASVML